MATVAAMAIAIMPVLRCATKSRSTESDRLIVPSTQRLCLTMRSRFLISQFYF
jgi:hypothetical protein